jgi:phi13 family phage major tail protein
MPETPNKVRYNLKNVHYAKVTFDSDGNASFGTPVRIPGAVSLSLDANGEPEVFWADGVAYYIMANNQGYNGDLEVALIPDSFRSEILKEIADAHGVLVERADVEVEHFALLFEFDGDKRHIRHVLYDCTASRPKIEGKTTTDQKEVQTETLTIASVPLPNGLVKSKTGTGTDSATYDGWYAAVYEPSAPTATSDQTTGEG